MWTIISVLVENKPGVLFKATNLFRAKNFNIDSISVGITENPEFSRMTITTLGDEAEVSHIMKQLNKMIDTVEVTRLDEKMSVYRELVLIKIKVGDPAQLMEIMNISNAFDCKIHDVRQSSIIVEITATPDKINAYTDMIKRYGIVEIARTGLSALPRGS